VLLTSTNDMRKYRFESPDFTEENLQAFLEDFTNDKLSPHLKSEEIPSDWDANPVKVLVGKNHDQVAFDPTKHVFVEYYAPWCGHCKTLVPIWEKLAQALVNHKQIVIAKMDATANEAKDVRIQSYPTIKFYPATEGKQIIDYEKQRSFDDFVQFLEEKTGLNLGSEEQIKDEL